MINPIPNGLLTAAAKVAAHIKVTDQGKGSGVSLDLKRIYYYEPRHGDRHGNLLFADGTQVPFDDLADLAAMLNYPLQQAARKVPNR